MVRIIRSKGEIEILKQEFVVPLSQSDLPDRWHRISHPQYEDIHWTYGNSPSLVSNGIKVGQLHLDTDVEDLWRTDSLQLTCPNVSVFDPDGHLPLLLQRTGIATSKYPFHDLLLSDVVKDLLAFMIVNAPQEGPITQIASDYRSRPTYNSIYPGLSREKNPWLSFASLANGSSPINVWHPKTMMFDRVLAVPWMRAVCHELESLQTTPQDPIVAFDMPEYDAELRRWFRDVFDPYSYSGPVPCQKRRGSRMLLRQKTYEELRRPRLIGKYYWDLVKTDALSNGWVLLSSGVCGDPLIDYEKLGNSLANVEHFEGISEWYISQEASIKSPVSPIAQAWLETVGTLVIPFDLDERRQKLHRAYDALRDYIAVQERVKEKLDQQRKKEAADFMRQ